MRRAEVFAVSVLAFASVAAAWALPRPMPAAVALAIPVAWASLFLYVPARAAGWWAWREVVRAAPRPEDRRAFGHVLLLAFALLIWGLDWGLTDSSWAADELRPDWVRDVLRQGFGSGWYDRTRGCTTPCWPCRCRRSNWQTGSASCRWEAWRRGRASSR